MEQQPLSPRNNKKSRRFVDDQQNNNSDTKNSSKKTKTMTMTMTTKNPQPLLPRLTFVDVSTVVLASGYVPWYDAVRIGAVNRVLRNIWYDHRSTPGVWEDLLVLLNRMNSFHKCCCCGMSTSERSRRSRRGCYNNPDPRGNSRYDSWSIRTKCRALTRFSTVLVTNFRSYIHYNHITNDDYLPNGYNDWNWNNDQEEDWAIFHRKKPQRSAYIRYLIVHAMARSELYTTPFRFQKAFLKRRSFLTPDIIGIDLTTDATFIQESSTLFDQVVPGGSNEDIERFIQHHYESDAERNILGPILTKRLLLFAPFFENNHYNETVPVLPDFGEHQPTLLGVCNLVLEGGFLQWHEAIRIGAVSKGLRKIWYTHESTSDIWDDLLSLLNTMNSFNQCQCCGGDMFPASEETCDCARDIRGPRGKLEGNPDPRSFEVYDDWPTQVKCSQLAAFTSRMVQNFRSYIDYECLTNYTTHPNYFQTRSWEALSRKMKKRYSFINQLIMHSLARSELYQGIDHFTSDFSGLRPHTTTGRKSIEPPPRSIERIFNTILPGTDEDIERFIRSEYESEYERNILGPVLTKNLLFFAPFFYGNDVLLLLDLD